MMEETSGWLWIIIDVLAVLVLAGALIYATMMWRQRRKDYRTKHAQEEVTREHYRRNE
jgi:flagellar basal body-associated protein FliL